MFDSILDDIKNSYRSGHMITRLIMINVGIFVITALMGSFAKDFYNNTFVYWIGVPGNPITLLFRPWTLISYMFVHGGFWHVAMNMLFLYWFGRIVGDMIGDKHILPIYFLGGLAGAIAYIVSYFFMYGYVESYMVGASAAIMAIVIVAGRINPEKEFNLLLFGRVQIKWIILVLIIIDLVFIGKDSNRGGHIGHLGGMVMGWIYFNQIGVENDLETRMNRIFNWIGGFFQFNSGSRRKSPLSVKYKSDKIKSMSERRADSEEQMQQRVDEILDKIKKKGYDSLTDLEKETLYQASKK